jgi:hypothetical protein
VTTKEYGFIWGFIFSENVLKLILVMLLYMGELHGT